MRKHELAAAILVSSLVLLSSIVATLYGVSPFDGIQTGSDGAGFVTGDYHAARTFHYDTALTSVDTNPSR